VDELTEFETAVLERIAEVNSRYRAEITELVRSSEVADRGWTGAGGFITLVPNAVHFEPHNLELHADAVIQIPGLKDGLGAILFVRDGRADWLELTMFDGDGEWWGDSTGYRIVPGNVWRPDAT
jgi:hypothetical protein